MVKIFASPARYIQGPKLLLSSADELSRIGQAPLVICDAFVWSLIGEQFCQYLQTAGFRCQHQLCGNEASQIAIANLSEQVDLSSIDFVIGLGGGKTLDSAKAFANQQQVPIVIIPTTAATDAPTSALSVLYSEAGHFEAYQFYAQHPRLVLVDSTIISQAPVRFLISGMADALATWVEVQAIQKSGATNLLGGQPTLAAIAIAKECEATIFTHGLQAVAANQAQVVTPALEQVIEANTLLSGLGFENGGLAAAHAIHNGFSAVTNPTVNLTHGEKVAFATLVQLILENRSQAELARFLTFYQALQLPTTLSAVGLTREDYAQLLAIGERATHPQETLRKTSATLTAAEIADAMIALDQYVTAESPRV